MKKAAKILFLIAAILSLVGVLTYLILGIVYAALGASIPLLVDAINNGTIPNDSGLPADEFAPVLAGTLIGLGVWFILTAAFGIASAVICFKARNTDKKALFIIAIVLGVISMTAVPTVAGIFGLIAGDTLE